MRTQGIPHSIDDPRNADILISINDAMKRRDEAAASCAGCPYELLDT